MAKVWQVIKLKTCNDLFIKYKIASAFCEVTELLNKALFYINVFVFPV